ncbi:MAG: M48 family metallopeptidase [Nitrospinae bacterium]|nr:M48 family metallopeptidase [Nitrospinota bacterium]
MEQHDLRYRISYRDIKYPRLEFTTGELLLVLPFGHKHEMLLEKHNGWIWERVNFIGECLQEAAGKKLFERTNKEFKDIVYSSVKKASKELDVKVRGVYFRKMRTKWASLSSKKNLTINRVMMYLPLHLIKYVILHEMTHLIEKRHNDRFWGMLLERCKRYREMEKEMFIYWVIINRHTH